MSPTSSDTTARLPNLSIDSAAERSAENLAPIRPDTAEATGSPNGDIDRDFDFDADGARDDRATVLVWRARPGDPAAEVTVTLNDTLVQTVNFGADVERTFHETVEAGVLKETGNNILFKITSGSGELTLSDVIMWYKQP